MHNHKKYILLLLVITGMAASSLNCTKYNLLKDEAQPAIPAGAGNKDKTIWEFVSENNFHTSDLTAISMYGKIIQSAGLQSLLDSTDKYTVILPSDTAVSRFIRGLGYQRIDDVPVAILKNLLLDNIFEGSIQSSDLGINETRKFETLNGDYIYMTRQSNATDGYLLYINQNDSLSSPAVPVRTQNLEFKNGVVHVVDQFTYFALKKANPDPIDTSKISVTTDTFFVSKDVTLRPGNYAKQNFNDPNEVALKGTNDPNFQRNALVEYPLAAPSFGNIIGTAKLHCYFFLTTTASFNISVSLSGSQPWDESTVTYNTAPTFNAVPIVAGTFSSSQLPGWLTFDVTPAVSAALSSSQSSIGFRMLTSLDGNYSFRPKEYLGGTYASFITLSSPPKTILTLGANNTVTVNAANGSQAITLDNIRMNGTDDKNVSYTVQSLPENGYLVAYGLPLAVGSSFSQDDVAKGGIKYLYKGSGSADQMTLQAKDFQGGYYPDLLTVQFQVQ
jgi:hypothetical protein